MKLDDLLRSRLGSETFSAARINDTIAQALASAGLDCRSGPMKEVTDVIRRSLQSAGLQHGDEAACDGEVIDVDDVREVPMPRQQLVGAGFAVGTGDDRQAAVGQFLRRTYRGPQGSRNYKLYVPASLAGDGAPLIVMLHGCTQSPDDFAAGTRMNQLAEAHGFLVAYPAQSSRANRSRCWNWFVREHQRRGAGEPAILSGLVQEIAAQWRVDPARMFVAGLSAGAAMAVVLGREYPDLFSGIGAHSGLPHGAAHDLPSALAAMKRRGRGGAGIDASPAAGSPRRVRTIVFHGDADATVHPANSVAIAEHAVNGDPAASTPPLRKTTERGSASSGCTYTRTIHRDSADRAVLEQWLIHGAGHGWSGGSASGSFTEPGGPDASREIVRFFLELDSAANAT